MKTRAKTAEERKRFLQKLNKIPIRFKNCGGNANQKTKTVGIKSNIPKIKISRDRMGSFVIKNFSIDGEFPLLIKQERIDDEYELAHSVSVNEGVMKKNVEKNSVSTQCHSSDNELWLYVGRNVNNTVDAQIQTSPTVDEYGYCRPYCQYLLTGQFCGPTCQFIGLIQ